MFRRFSIFGFAALAIGVIYLGGFAGCAPGPVTPDDDGDDNGDVTPSGVTFGAVQPDPEVVEARPQAINPFAANASAQLPATADLTKDLPPMGDQGQLGSCTAWAAGYAGATYTANRSYDWGADTADHQASPGYLYEKLLEQDNLNCGSGTYISTAMNLLVQLGCASLDYVGYSDQACSAGTSAGDAENFRVGSFNRVVESDRHAVRGELAAGRIVVFGARLYDDFPEFTGSDVYQGSGTFLTQGEQHAAHAMALVGYDDDREAYRVMNSWSSQWGDGGYMWMAYEAFETTAFEAYSIEPAGEREPPTPPGPEPGPEPEPEPTEDPQAYLDEAYQFADADPITREQMVYLVFFYHFDAPVYLRTVTVTDPSGNTGQQTYDTWYIDGYVYFVQTGGFQWDAGIYTLEFDTQTEAGNDVIYSGQATIEPLDGGDGESEGICSNLCIFSYDGECDDGGPGSDYFLCDYGTDCADCGTRDAEGGGGDTLCTDTCRFAGDGECDDGGPGALYFECDYGTDCTDCGPREIDGDDTEEVFCTDSCRFAYDGECDDGGPGADYAECEFGTDCYDCGPRSFDDLEDWDDGSDDYELCTNTCYWAYDGECDDGGPGAMYAECDLGTDCYDCGPRTWDDLYWDDSDDLWDDDFKGVARKFRGVPVETPASARNLPAAGVREGILGANRKPAKVTPAQTE